MGTLWLVVLEEFIQTDRKTGQTDQQTPYLCAIELSN